MDQNIFSRATHLADEFNITWTFQADCSPKSAWSLWDDCISFLYILTLKNNRCEAYGELTWENTYNGCILKVKYHQCDNADLTFVNTIAKILESMEALTIIDVKPVVNWIEGTNTMGAF